MGKWCLHASSLIFDQIVIKVAGNQDRHKSSDEFDFGPLVSMAHLYVFWNEIWPWHIGLRWAIVALWATCLGVSEYLGNLRYSVHFFVSDTILQHLLNFLAHLSRRLTRWAYSIPIVRRPSVVRRRPSSSTLSNLNISEASVPILITFYV